MNVANRLTVLRMLLIPLVIAALLLPEVWPAFSVCSHWVAALLFLAAAITDILDGKYARKHNVVTDFGKLMDPIADKMLVVSAFVMLSCLTDAAHPRWLLHPVLTILFIAREFLISGVRQLAAAKGVVIAAGKLGKFKTTFQDIIVISLLLYDEFPFRYLNPYLMILIEVLVYFTLALSIASAVEYIVKNKGVLNLNDR
ncbi:MAG: CDP-diacylglycerol--glycerol-3-phosphate 3-phosphatidyltransferase [Clostridia bacterium]|jgi:CDP-diacylglycerol--glycerol-3-phosphate 3-phosphatidyltransferase|nr:CDP-diacylglycerol--glycerol-3-phosphate 3-phosphatidyltransferase [Clostridia bacterium]MBR3038739.1 CDP-diacylglycerol--glycerol-3-phosphate 3-phosphatidyltransferase [Clostridia bacterium]